MVNRRPTANSSLASLLREAIHVYNQRYDLAAASKPLAYALAARRTFTYARHDPRNKVNGKPRHGVVSPEIQAYANAMVLCGWVACVHESKAIWHYNESSVGGQVFLNHEFLPNLMRAIAIGRSKAILEKVKEGRYHPEFRVNDAITLLEKALSPREEREAR